MENTLYRGKDSFTYTESEREKIADILHAAGNLRTAENELGNAERQVSFLHKKLIDKKPVKAAEVKEANHKVFEMVAQRNTRIVELRETVNTARDAGIPNWVLHEAKEYGNLRPQNPENYFTKSLSAIEPSAADVAFFLAVDQYRQSMIRTVMQHFEKDDWSNDEIEQVYGTELIGDLNSADPETREAYEAGTYGVLAENALSDMPACLENYTNTELEHLICMELHLQNNAQIPYRLTYIENAPDEPVKTRNEDVGDFSQGTIKTFFCPNEKTLLETMKQMAEQHKGEPYWVEDMGGILQQNRLSDYEYQAIKTVLPKIKETHKEKDVLDK